MAVPTTSQDRSADFTMEQKMEILQKIAPIPPNPSAPTKRGHSGKI